MAFKELPRDYTLDELWRAGLVYSRPNDHEPWRFDTPYQPDPPSSACARWRFAIFVED